MYLVAQGKQWEAVIIGFADLWGHQEVEEVECSFFFFFLGIIYVHFRADYPHSTSLLVQLL